MTVSSDSEGCSKFIKNEKKLGIVEHYGQVAAGITPWIYEIKFEPEH